MADAKKCDRCGVLFEPYISEQQMCESEESESPSYIRVTSGKRAMNSTRTVNVKYIDLCSECAKSFDKWRTMQYERWIGNNNGE